MSRTTFFVTLFLLLGLSVPLSLAKDVTKALEDWRGTLPAYSVRAKSKVSAEKQVLTKQEKYSVDMELFGKADSGGREVSYTITKKTGNGGDLLEDINLEGRIFKLLFVTDVLATPGRIHPSSTNAEKRIQSKTVKGVSGMPINFTVDTSDYKGSLTVWTDDAAHVIAYKLDASLKSGKLDKAIIYVEFAPVKLYASTKADQAVWVPISRDVNLYSNRMMAKAEIAAKTTFQEYKAVDLVK